MSETRFQSSRLCIPLKTGEICRVSVHFRPDGELSIDCPQAPASPVFLPPDSDPCTVEARAEAIVLRTLARQGLI